MNEIFIYEEIGAYGITDRDFIAQLNQFKGQDVKIRVNSPGGSVFQGYAMYNAIKQHGQCDFYIDGLSASIVSFIMLAGRRIFAAKNAMIMIHNPSVDNTSGDSKELKSQAETLDKIGKMLTASYAERTGIATNELTAMLDKETWLTSQEALEKGFIDEITDDILKSNSAGSLKVKNSKAIFLSYTKIGESEPEALAVFNNLSTLLGLKKADNNQITAKVKGLILQNKEYQDKLNIAIQNQKDEAVLLVDYAIEKQFIEKRYRAYHLEEFDKDFKRARTELVSCFKKPVILTELIVDAVVKVKPSLNLEIKTATKAKTEWNLEDYRKHAPQELENNPELFKQLINEQKNGKFKG